MEEFLESVEQAARSTLESSGRRPGALEVSWYGLHCTSLMACVEFLEDGEPHSAMLEWSLR